MSAPSDLRTLVLHGLRLKGFADAASVSEAAGVRAADAKPMLDQLVGDGLAAYRDGKLSGYSLTKDGRARHAELLVQELEVSGARPSVDAAYRRFLVLNPELLGVCTAWQLREVDGESTVNDHSDAGYDASVVEQLADLDARVQPICATLGEALSRFSAYGPRLASAAERVRSGDTDWFTKPMIPSYHTVWFEMHEDLLCTLGIERGSEDAG